jgi:hypothetical protein
VKLLVVASALDLRLPYGMTAGWWQFLKALAEIEVELVVTPYAGRAVESPWWRAYENPCLIESEAVRRTMKYVKGIKIASSHYTAIEEPIADRAFREIADRITRPKWERHLARIIQREGNIDAVLFLTVPLNQLNGVARETTRRFGIPVYYYDADIPASLPSNGGFGTGFRIYEGSDPSEYEAFFSNSKGGAKDLLKLGARRVFTIYFGVDEAVFAPMRVAKDIDASFYGNGPKYRENWIRGMITEPSLAMPDRRFLLLGKNFEGFDIGRTRQEVGLSVARIKEVCNRSKVNLLINRGSHASVYGSSTLRLFELAAMRSCMLSSPYLGVEEWFEPQREIVMIAEPDEATEIIRWLLAHDSERERIAKAAHDRAIAQHTFRHRAAQMVRILQGGSGPIGGGPPCEHGNQPGGQKLGVSVPDL